MEFVGNNNKTYTTVLPESGKFPALTIAAFQEAFHFLSAESESAIVQQASVARIVVHRELLDLLTDYQDLSAFSVDKFGDEVSAVTLYTQAVFALTAHFIIGNQISTDTTAEAADRQEALTQKTAHCSVLFRRAIDLLTHTRETYCFEVV